MMIDEDKQAICDALCKALQLMRQQLFRAPGLLG